ncbi:MAG: hypothetical protein ACRDGQ_04270 [Candidatus Limnocylindrales bacterium]
MSAADRLDRLPSRATGLARHQLGSIDERGLVAARAAELVLAAAEARQQARWVTFLEPLPERLRDGDLADLRWATLRARAAFGPKDSIRDVVPADLTEPFLDAIDRLIRELNRFDWAAREG